MGRRRRPVSRRRTERRGQRRRRAQLWAGLRSAVAWQLQRALALGLVLALGAGAWWLLEPTGARQAPMASLVAVPSVESPSPIVPPAESAIPVPVPAASPLPPAHTQPRKGAPETATVTRPRSPAVDTRPTWLRNAVATPEANGRPMIAIVIDDLGIDRRNADRVVALPGPLTLAFMTYAHNVADQARAARAAGHELLVHVPMEPDATGLNAGPNVLSVDIPPDVLRQRIDWALSRFDGYVGMNNHMGSRFTASAPGMTLLLAELHRRGLLFLDSRTTAQTVAAAVARQANVPFAERNVFLDNESSASAVWLQLRRVETVARQKGFAVAIGHPHAGTIDALAKWLPTLGEKGFVLVPVSAIVKLHMAPQFANIGRSGL
jgi:polysaccharide deacetylase 2 family uncharacterized protein YibQ